MNTVNSNQSTENENLDLFFIDAHVNLIKEELIASVNLDNMSKSDKMVMKHVQNQLCDILKFLNCH